MNDFQQRFEIVYRKFAEWGQANGFKPSKLAFSRFLGVAQGTMQRWEYQGSLPSGRDLKTIHDKLGFSYDWLISGEGEMFDRAAETIAAQEREISQLKQQLATGSRRQNSTEPIGKVVGQE